MKEKIRALREHYRLSQTEFGEICNVSRQTVAKWERGLTVPRAEPLAYLCAFFKLDIGYFTENITDAEFLDSVQNCLPLAPRGEGGAESAADGAEAIPVPGSMPYELPSVPVHAMPCETSAAGRSALREHPVFRAGAPAFGQPVFSEETTAPCPEDDPAEAPCARRNCAGCDLCRQAYRRGLKVLAALFFAGAAVLAFLTCLCGLVVFSPNSRGDVSANSYGWGIEHFCIFAALTVLLLVVAILLVAAIRRMRRNKQSSDKSHT